MPPRYTYDYYTVTLPTDAFISPDIPPEAGRYVDINALCHAAINEAEERCRIVAIPCEWVAIPVIEVAPEATYQGDGNLIQLEFFHDDSIEVSVRRRRLYAPPDGDQSLASFHRHRAKLLGELSSLLLNLMDAKLPSPPTLTIEAEFKFNEQESSTILCDVLTGELLGALQKEEADNKLATLFFDQHVVYIYVSEIKAIPDY